MRLQRFLQRLDAPLAIAEEGDARGLERVGVGGRLQCGDARRARRVSASFRYS